MIPKRDDVFSARLDYAPRVPQILVPLTARLGQRPGVAPAEERLPPRARAHAHLKSALTRQRSRARADLSRVIVRDDAHERLLDAPQRREAHAQAAQVIRQSR